MAKNSPSNTSVRPAGRDQGELSVRPAGRIELSQALRAYLERSGLSFRAGDSTPDTRRDNLRQSYRASVAAKISVGYWLAEIRQAEGQQAFEVAAAETGISRTTAYDALDALTLFNRLPDLDAVMALGKLDVSSALVCKKWDDAELIPFVRGEEVRGVTLDRAIDLPWRQFDQVTKAEESERVKKLEKQVATLETRLETTEAAKQKIHDQLRHRIAALNIPEFCLVAREESVALGEQISISIDALELLVRDSLLNPPASVADAEKFAAMAAGTAFHSLRGLHARLGELLAQLAEAFPEMADKVGFEHQLKPGELDAFKHARELILGRIKTGASNREAERHNAKGGRGRPRDIKKVK